MAVDVGRADSRAPERGDLRIALAASVSNGWNSPVSPSMSVGTAVSGLPQIRLRCSPTPSVGALERTRSTASAKAGVFTIIDADDSVPA
jgi:hypothetical protein